MIQMQWFLHYRMGVFLGRPPRARRGARPFDDATRRAGADGLALRRPIDHTLQTEVPMKLPLQISFHGMEPSEALEAAAIKKAHKLEEFYSDIVSCRVVIRSSYKSTSISIRVGRLQCGST